jgi:hypothetical protein
MQTNRADSENSHVFVEYLFHKFYISTLVVLQNIFSTDDHTGVQGINNVFHIVSKVGNV